MGTHPDNSELARRIAKRDAEEPSPEERAKRVWAILQTYDPDLTTWDVLCFCAEFIGLVSQRYQWLIPMAKRFAGLVYTAHYHDETLLDARSDRITKQVEPVDTGEQPNAGPKSLFDLPRTDAPSDRTERSDQGFKSAIHLPDNRRAPSETERPQDAGGSNGGNADSPTG